MAPKVLTMALILTWTTFVLTTSDISFSALETILNLDAPVTVKSVIENSIPIYRKDLPHDYVAYWQVVINDKDFVVVSAGPETGDHRLIHEGPLPTFTSQLDVHSLGRCARYVQLAPDIAIMCEDKNGKILTTTHFQLLQLKDNVTQSGRHSLFVGPTVKQDEDVTENSLHKFVQSAGPDMEKEFKKRRENVVRENIWIEADEYKKAFTHVRIGDTIKLPVTPDVMIIAEKGSEQGVVCEATGICDGADNTRVAIDVQKTDNGIRYIEFDIKPLKSDSIESVSFRIVIREKAGLITRRYVTTQTRRRSKRGASDSSIPHESLFPEYNQFEHGKCHVGCGPVAWASVFCYMDRIAHQSSSYPGEYKSLYRSGVNGTTGSDNEVAPDNHHDTRIQNYIIRLNRILGTFCILNAGATIAPSMDRVSCFYTDRVKDGQIKVQYGPFWGLTAIYEAKFRDAAISYIKRGFPAIIGWRTDGTYISQHYPIATKHRIRQRHVCRKVCKCFIFWCCSNVCGSVMEHEFFLHMGWGGSGNGWKLAEAYMTAAAVHDD